MNVIEKEFIPYQQSVDMKALGFDEPCFGYYEDNGLTITFPSTSENGWKWVGNHLIPAKNTKAPLYSQAFRWFREKFNLRSSVMDFIDDVTGIEWDYSIAIIGTDLDDKGDYIPLIDYSVDDPNRKYKTYEEAELGCLIKLIEITKSGSLKA